MLFLSTASLELSQVIHNKEFGVELRLDLFPRIDKKGVEQFIQNSRCPVMLTLRKASQGGRFQGSEEERESWIESLLSLGPSFFDLEYDMRPEFIRGVFQKYPKTQIVLSYHCFEGIPEDLDAVYHRMIQYEAFTYKIAVTPHSTSEALRMLLFAKNHSKVSIICMGEKGEFARVLGPVVGNLVDYGSLSCQKKTAPGQLTFDEWIDIYRYPCLNRETSVYGLIGDPVEKSLGHIYHNGVFQKRGANAVYVKMVVTHEALAECIPLLRRLGIRGLSVTIPLKEKILPFLDEMDPTTRKIGASNTVLFKEGRLIGTNTDSVGALDAVEKRILVRGKRVVLIGAGGAARAIGFEAKVRGADVLILNRTVSRAKDLAADLGCKGGSLEEIPEMYDVLIHCSPDPIPIDPNKMRPNAWVMDIVYVPRETELLKEAIRRGCSIIYGEEMFLNQAKRQTAFWMGT